VGLRGSCDDDPWPSPWHQDLAAVRLLEKGAATSIAIPARLWDYLGNDQPKVAESHRIERWNRREAGRPIHSAEHLKALRLAAKVFDRGGRREERDQLARALAASPAMRRPLVRRLVMELRGARSSAPRGLFFAPLQGTAAAARGTMAA
jgi:hypothetical protein